jgi:hypothetical protein
MRKRNGVFGIIYPVFLTICLYIVFFDRISSKPNEAGFWFILAMGMSIGVALTRIILWLRASRDAKK